MREGGRGRGREGERGGEEEREGEEEGKKKREGEGREKKDAKIRDRIEWVQGSSEGPQWVDALP